MKYYFPLYLDAGNRGCQGIAEGTAQILNASADQLIAYCSDIELDRRLGVAKHVTLIPIHKLSLIDKIKKQFERLNRKKQNIYDLHYKYQYKWFLNQISKEDIMISTGGDMMCYGNNMVNITNNILHKRGVKTILWGCSMGKENETPEKVETLRNFTLIYARETLSFDYFKSLGLKNVVCYPDPAFILQPEKTILPSLFSKSNNVIGINISPFVLKNNDINSSFGKAVRFLFDYILKETNFSILLIPHVLWNKQDDRVTAEVLKNLYSQDERISILDSDKLNYMQIRYVISKCCYFLGARTHAVISAYSTCVPTIALGYSIKSKGIAKDLGLPKETVIDCTNCTDEEILVESFKYLHNNKIEIGGILKNNIPAYINQVYQVKGFLSKI